MIGRRGFLLGLAAGITAPAIVHAGNLMPVKPMWWDDPIRINQELNAYFDDSVRKAAEAKVQELMRQYLGFSNMSQMHVDKCMAAIRALPEVRSTSITTSVNFGRVSWDGEITVSIEPKTYLEYMGIGKPLYGLQSP